MGGVFGVVSKDDCVNDVFFGTDYNSHLGTKRGGMAVRNAGGIVRFIHDISNAQFRSKFEEDIRKLYGRRGIGVISDYEDQPLIIGTTDRVTELSFENSWDMWTWRPRRSTPTWTRNG